MIALSEKGDSFGTTTTETKPNEVSASTPETAPERPAGLPEKFDSWEAMAKSYAELERKLAGGKTDAPATETEKAKQPDDFTIQPETEKAAETSEDMGLENLLERAGFEYGKLQAEVAELGDFKPETREGLYKTFGREAVEAFMSGQRAEGQLIRNRIMGSVGGEENYSAMGAWLARTMTPAQLAHYNEQVSSTNVEVVEATVQAQYARYTQEHGSQPQRLISGTTSAAPSSDVFKSQAEITAAMSDPRYATDPAYRQALYAKLDRSN